MESVVAFFVANYLYIAAYVAVGALWGCFKFLKLSRHRALDAKEVKLNALRDESFLNQLPIPAHIRMPGERPALMESLLGSRYDVSKNYYYGSKRRFNIKLDLSREDFIKTIDENLKGLRPRFSYAKWSLVSATWPISFSIETLFGLKIPLRFIYTWLKKPLVMVRDSMWDRIVD